MHRVTHASSRPFKDGSLRQGRVFQARRFGGKGPVAFFDDCGCIHVQLDVKRGKPDVGGGRRVVIAPGFRTSLIHWTSKPLELSLASTSKRAKSLCHLAAVRDRWEVWGDDLVFLLDLPWECLGLTRVFFILTIKLDRGLRWHPMSAELLAARSKGIGDEGTRLIFNNRSGKRQCSHRSCPF